MKASPIILCQISNLVFNFYFYFFCLQGKRRETKNKNKNKNKNNNYKMFPTLTKLYRNS